MKRTDSPIWSVKSVIADEVYLNGQVVTMESDRPYASAFAVTAGRFLAVGSKDEARATMGPHTPTIDLKGKTVIPGFIETHCHLSLYAMVRLQVDCATPPNRSVEDVKHRIWDLTRHIGPGRWIKGWGYDDTLIAESRHLTTQDLNEAAPRNPVFVSHASGHLAYANSIALEIAGIGRACPQPTGGEVDLDPDGHPTGLLKEESAQRLVTRHIPPYGNDELKAAMQETVKDYYRAGITSAHDAAIGYFRDADQVLRAYRELSAENRLDLRAYLTLVEPDFRGLLETGDSTHIESDRLKLGAVKFFQDGSIQALTAALNEPYLCRPDHRDNLLHDQKVLDKFIETYHRRGCQIAIHANGDRAIVSALRALERACRRHPGRDLRHMIIHCQMAHRDQLSRMKQIGVIPSFFVNHVYYWGDRHADLFLGDERAQRINPLASAVEAGLEFTLHSDLPITPVDPLFSMHCAVNRQTRAGVVLGADERIQPLDALKAYTTWAARCSFEETDKGSIREGKLADFAVLSHNPINAKHSGIKDIQVLQTVIGGTTVYCHPSITAH